MIIFEFQHLLDQNKSSRKKPPMDPLIDAQSTEDVVFGHLHTKTRDTWLTNDGIFFFFFFFFQNKKRLNRLTLKLNQPS
jgi:hypothetical protein